MLVAPACVDYGPHQLGLNEQELKCTDTYGTYGIPKLSSFVCHQVGRYLTTLFMLYRIVSGHPRCVRRGIRMEDGTRARSDPTRLFDRIMNCCHSWCPPSMCVCHMVKVIPLQGWLLIRICATPSDMGNVLFTESKHRIINFIIL
jgi:hypothetical protein